MSKLRAKHQRLVLLAVALVALIGAAERLTLRRMGLAR